jgi:hypothetical protein
MNGTDTMTLTMWRDHDEELIRLPSMSASSRRVGGGDPAELAAGLYRDGIRRVALDAPVDLSGGTAAGSVVSRLLLLGHLTSWGMVVDWDVRLGADAEVWQLLNHLYPPRAVLDAAGADGIRDRWRENFYLCKCAWRQGPGFVEVRDRRAGSLFRFVIDEPDYLEAIERLSVGCRIGDVPAAVLDDFASEGLAGKAGDFAWWIPYRVRRWPSPALVV